MGITCKNTLAIHDFTLGKWGSIIGNASCVHCLFETCLSSLFLKELTVFAETTSSGNLFQEFPSRILKKVDLCKTPLLISLGLYNF